MKWINTFCDRVSLFNLRLLILENCAIENIKPLKLKFRKECVMFKVRTIIFDPFTVQIHVKISF